MTIRDLIHQKINKNKYVIPAIQRKYVWKEKNICKYFDSIMRDYPTGHIMLWNISSKYINSKQITFYKFLDEYVENTQEFNKAIGNVAPGDDYYAVLDGQQRIQSLIIALSGKYVNKNGVKKELYINLLPKNYDKEKIELYEEDDTYQSNYEFKFFEENAALKDKNGIWFKVKKILNINNSKEIRNALEEYKEKLDNHYDYAYDLLMDLMDRINKNHDILKIEPIDSKFKDINEVLEIFIRANSAGEQLSKSDLLFSTVVLRWDKGRDIIDEFLKEINAKDTLLPFKFNIDFIMRTFLFIQGEDTTMKIEYFDNIAEGIEDAWPNISKSIKKVVRYLRTMGFSSSTINSYNSLIPLVYYAYNRGSFTDEDVSEMRKYVIVAQLKRLFGVASNQALKNSKEVLKDKKDFKLNYFYSTSFVAGRTFKVNMEDIKEWLNFEKDTMDATLVLRLLYPDINYGYGNFHKDHVHPKALVEELNNKEFNKQCNKVPNLEMLLGHENVKKQETPLKVWAKTHKVDYITEDMSLELVDFLDFIKDRSGLMTDKLKEIFEIE